MPSLEAPLGDAAVSTRQPEAPGWPAWLSTLAVQGVVDLCEPIYSSRYSLEPLPAEWLAAWREPAAAELHLPAPNPFIPTDFSLLEVRSRVPPLCPPL